MHFLCAKLYTQITKHKGLNYGVHTTMRIEFEIKEVQTATPHWCNLCLNEITEETHAIYRKGISKAPDGYVKVYGWYYHKSCWDTAQHNLEIL